VAPEDRVALHREDDGVMDEDDADGGFAEACRLGGCRAGFCVLADVLVQGLEIVEALVFAHQLHDRRKQVIGSPG